MIQLIRVPNPFEPRKHEIEEAYYTGRAIPSYINVDGMDCVLNGQVVENPAETIPQDGEQLIVMPHVGGKGFRRILGFAAMIALSVYAGNSAGGLWKGALGKGFAAHTVGALLASGAVMFIGGKIINSIFPQQNPSFSYGDQDTSQSYGWDLPTPTQIAGGVVGETYGECIPAAQLLEQHVETIDDKQYLNLLYCGGYGPIDSIDNLRIDYTSLDNFTGVQVETRLGTNDQKPISFFKNTPLDQSVGVEVPDDNSVTRTSDSTNASALEVTLEWPGGLFYINDNNNYANATVKFKLEYRLTGTTTWRNFNKDNPDYVYEATAGTNAAVRKSYLVDGLDAGQYDVRITTVDRPKTTRYQSMYQWTLLTSYIDGVYARPGKVLVALRILATNQLSGGVPSLNWRQKRSTVWVWNPTLDKPAYEEKPADNPIWAAYDILHGCKRLKNINTGEYEFVVSGVPKEALSTYYDEWASAAAYADEEITNQDGEKEPRYRFDAFFDSPQKRITAAQKAATIGHAAIIPHGRNYGIVVDRPGAITQIFGEGRTTVSSVKGSFTSKADRARAIEVTYNDTQNDFKNTVLTVRSPNYNTDTGSDNTAQLSLFGVKRRSQAYREAITALATNERQLQFVTMSADIDAIVAEYGDVVGYSHAVSRIGIASGRLVDATTTTLTLDKDVTMDAGKSYEIYVQKANDALVKFPIVAKDYTGPELTLTTALDAANVPAQYDNYAFGEVGKAVKPFRVVSASRDGDMLVSLKLAEYDEAIYADELDYSKYPAIDYTTAPTLDTVASVTATEQTVKEAYTSNSNILVTWAMTNKGTSPDSFRVFLKSQNSAYADIKNVRSNECVFSSVPAGETYEITVYGVFDAVLYGSASTTITIAGASIAGESASAFHAFAVPEGIQLTWNLAKDTSVASYRIDCGGQTIGHGLTANQFFWAQRAAGTYTFTLTALDADGNAVGGALATSIAVVLPGAVTEAEAVCVYRHYENGSTGYDVDVTYKLPVGATTAEVYYKTNNTSMGLVGVIPEGTAGDAIGFTRDWKYAGVSADKVTIPGAKLGDKYRIRIMSRSRNGLLCADTDAVYIDETVSAKTEVPNTPQNFTKDFSTAGFTFRWSDVTNTDIAFYELRTNKNAGAAAGLLTRVTGTTATVKLTARKGTVYLYAHNTTGRYSLPASVSYDYPMLAAPSSVTATQAPRAITLTVADKPAGAVGIHIYIKGKTLDTMIELTDTNQYTLTAPAYIYDVTACYFDLFGEGDMTQPIQATIEPYFDPAWIRDGTISIKKVDDVVARAVADAKQSVTDIAELKKTDTEIQSTVTETKKDLTSQITQNSDKITSVITNLGKSPAESGYSAITQLQDAVNLRVKKGDVINQINLTPEGTTIDGKYLHVTGTTKFDNNVIVGGMIKSGAITADKLTAGTISLTNDQAVSGGAVSLTANGLICQNPSGTSVVFNSGGMSFRDINGNKFSSVGRMIIGSANDGDKVVFSTAWDIAPLVLVAPVDLQTNTPSYNSNTITLDVGAEDISKSGFTVKCRTILKSGSSGGGSYGNTIGSYIASSGNKTDTYTFNIPSTATQANITLSVTADSVTWVGPHLDQSYYLGWSSVAIDWYVNDSIMFSDNVASSQKGSPVEKEISRLLTFNENSTVKLVMKFTISEKSNNMGSITMTTKPKVVLQNLEYNVTSDTVISQGKAMFIALDRNNAEYTIRR